VVPAIVDHCEAELDAYGNISNLERLVGTSDAAFKGFPFADSDIYKTLEALSWSQATNPRDSDRTWADDIEAILEHVQDDDGYIDSKIQGDDSRHRWDDLLDSHEMYCMGHLIQAGVAGARAAGDRRLLAIAQKAADCIVNKFGPQGDNGICGHPEIETALIELYRETGERKYLETARKMIDLRGSGLLKPREYFGFGSRYYVDQVPVRQAQEAMGHAVRQLYLEAGVVDLYLETGDRSLLEASERVWESAHGRKMYVTGGLGARHRDESFGDDFELPPDRSYSETCAAIADFQWSWRLLLATGNERYADAMERDIYNAIPVGASEDGCSYFYSNPLQVRNGHPEGTDFDSFVHRAEWFDCPCCPPNVARLYASLPAYASTFDDEGFLVLHLFSQGSIKVPLRDGGMGEIQIKTEYPWDGRIEISVPAGVDLNGIKVRVPSWCTSPAIHRGGDDARIREGFVEYKISAGNSDSVLDIDYPMPVQLVSADARIDAVRGCLAVTRGPLVYVIEQTDVSSTAQIENLEIRPDQQFVVRRDYHIGGTSAVVLQSDFAVTSVGENASTDSPYAQASAVSAEDAETAGASGASAASTSVQLVPYFLWGNRPSDSAAMRVWIPRVHEIFSE
jgi:DUF1680 family protein